MDALVILLQRLTLLYAIGLTPYLLIRNLTPRSGTLATLALAGMFACLLNTAIPVALHLLKIPLTASSLSATHGAFGALISIVTLLRLRATPALLYADDTRATLRPMLLLFVLFALLTIPYTPLAGIDTYKWQGLATNVRVEQNIPWMIHPLSLLGFTPRAYPSAQPLMLATIQILGHVGVEGGFFVMSLFCGVLGASTIGWLGQRLLPNQRHVFWLACFYLLSPVFMRYSHWATGRGLFLACLPLLAVAGTRLGNWRHLILLVLTLILLPLTHKTGILVIAMLPCSFLLAAIIPARKAPLMRLFLLLPFVLLAILIATPRFAAFPLGCLPGAVIRWGTRFSWILPAALVGMVLGNTGRLSLAWRWIIALAILSLPLSTAPDMYGALAALPWLTLLATRWPLTLAGRHPRSATMIIGALAAISLAGALTIVANRTRTATPVRVREAALFLESHDPLGPYRIHAPGRARVQMHAYVSGCPRFLLHHDPAVRFTWQRPPPLKHSGTPTALATAWLDYGRTLLEPADVGVDWYGVNPRDYYVLIDGEGSDEQPNALVWIYDHNGVRIGQPTDQQVERQTP